MLVTEISSMSKAVIDGSLVAHEPNPRAAQQIDLFSQQPLDSQFDWFLCHLSLTTQDRTAVHVQNFAVDVSRPFSAKKHDGPADILGRGDAANRD